MEQVVYCNVGEGQYGLKFTSEIGFFSYFTDYPIGMDDLNALPVRVSFSTALLKS